MEKKSIHIILFKCGWSYNQYSKCLQRRRSTKGVDAGGRLGGDKRLQRNNAGTPWKDYHRRQGEGGYMDGESPSRSQRKLVMHRGSRNTGVETGDALVGE